MSEIHLQAIADYTSAVEQFVPPTWGESSGGNYLQLWEGHFNQLPGRLVPTKNRSVDLLTSDLVVK